MHITIFKRPCWQFSFALGGIVAFAVTAVITVWEWLENPSGLFHDATATHWAFVYDTAISWLIPTFVQATLVAAVLHLGYRLYKRLEISTSNSND